MKALTIRPNRDTELFIHLKPDGAQNLAITFLHQDTLDTAYGNCAAITIFCPTGIVIEETEISDGKPALIPLS